MRVDDLWVVWSAKNSQIMSIHVLRSVADRRRDMIQKCANSVEKMAGFTYHVCSLKIALKWIADAAVDKKQQEEYEGYEGARIG